jgi:hypothetical protein
MLIFKIPKIMFVFFLMNRTDCSFYMLWVIISSLTVWAALRWGLGCLIFPILMFGALIYWAIKDFISWYKIYGVNI